MDMKMILKGLVALSIIAVLAGCATVPRGTGSTGLSAPGATEAGPPIEVQFERNLRTALACYGANWPTNSQGKPTIFGVSNTKDNTGKTDISDGGSGSFLSQDFAAILITALKRDGGFNVNDERLQVLQGMENQIRLGGPAVQAAISSQRLVNMSDFLIYASHDTLDLTGGQTFDARLGGVGPTFVNKDASVTTSVIINDFAGNSKGASSFQQIVGYTSVGFSVGNVIEGNLLTAGINFGNQQMLQLSPPVAGIFATIDALSQIPGAPNSVCLGNTGANGQNA